MIRKWSISFGDRSDGEGLRRWSAAHLLGDKESKTLCGREVGRYPTLPAPDDLKRCGRCIRRAAALEKTCDVDGCDRVGQLWRGLCKKHYTRLGRSGTPTGIRGTGGSFQETCPSWVGDDASYAVAHERLLRWRGKADGHRCTHCPSWAHEWAYDHTAPNERVSSTGSVYSVDPWHYFPLCRSCHRRFDLVNKRSAA